MQRNVLYSAIRLMHFKGLDFPQAMELWNTNLNGKSQNLKTKQIKSHIFSYVFLSSIAICVFINTDIFYDMLGSIATFKLS